MNRATEHGPVALYVGGWLPLPLIRLPPEEGRCTVRKQRALLA